MTSVYKRYNYTPAPVPADPEDAAEEARDAELLLYWPKLARLVEWRRKTREKVAERRSQ